MTETAIRQMPKTTKDKMVSEIETAIDDDALAVITFVIRDTDDDDESAAVKVLALMPPGSAEMIEELIHEAFDEVVQRQRTADPQGNDIVEAFHGKAFDQLSPAVQAYWEFNEDLAELLDILIERGLVRDTVAIYYTALKQFIRTGDFVMTPALFDFVEEGPKINGDEIPALCWVVASQLAAIDPLDPPEDFGAASAEDIAKVVKDFLYRVAAKEMLTCV